VRPTRDGRIRIRVRKAKNMLGCKARIVVTDSSG
jgi:hypothetical protein